MAAVSLGSGRIAFVDDADFSALAHYRWHIGGPGYAMANLSGGGSVAQEES